jgi:hypothetical protein
VTAPVDIVEWVGGPLDGRLSMAPAGATVKGLIDRGGARIEAPIRVLDDGRRIADYYAAEVSR